MSDPNVVTCPLNGKVCSGEGDSKAGVIGCGWFCAIAGECSVREIARHLGQLAENTLNLADIAAMMPDRKPCTAANIPDDDDTGTPPQDYMPRGTAPTT